MIQNPGYILKELSGVPYLLPYGQMIAEHRRGTKINNTGVYLWNLLATEHTMEEILFAAGKYYQVDAGDYADFEQEIRHFINTLLAHGILLQNHCHTSVCSNNIKHLCIAGLHLQLINFGDSFPEEFSAFTVSEPPLHVDLTISYHVGTPEQPENGTILLRNYELNVMELENKYIFTLPQTPEIFEMHLCKDGTAAEIYTIPLATREYKEKLFHAIRLLFLYVAQKHEMIAIHSVSILYRDKAWLFSAPSGTGKSTHANLWKDYLQIPTINGDLNLLAFENNTPVIHGIPWCGTSETYDTNTYSLGGIILLRQAPTDRIAELNPDEKQLLVSQRFISPSWTVELFEKNLSIAEKAVKQALVCRLNCTKEKSAMETVKQRIDKYLEDAH